MVAYSFRARFVEPILAGRKRQTIRALGRRRHAQPGELLQLYTGMRTKACRLIGRAPCLEAVAVELRFGGGAAPDAIAAGPAYIPDLDAFARRDGFADWGEMRDFWRLAHPQAFAAGAFAGVMIRWGDLL